MWTIAAFGAASGSAASPVHRRSTRVATSDASSTIASAVLLWLGLFAVYLSNIQVQSSLDNVTTALLPFSIVREHDLDLDTRVTYDAARDTLFLNFEGMRVRTAKDVKDIEIAVEGRCLAIARPA